MVSSEDLNDQLLPKGRLREPLSSLRRADAIVISEDMQNPEIDGAMLIWRVRRSITAPDVPPRPVVFCGIARPAKFVSQLKECGVIPAAEQFFRDHHAYSDGDVQTLLRLRNAQNSGGFVTTEKDAINLGDRMEALRPLAVIPVTMELQDADNAVDTMLRITAERKG
jgi:tetraacyldisaccharide 4'-kinase